MVECTIRFQQKVQKLQHVTKYVLFKFFVTSFLADRVGSQASQIVVVKG